MRLLIKRYASVKSDVVGFARVGSDSFTILKKDEKLRGVINGSEIFSSDIENSEEKISSLVSKILSSLCKKYAKDKITLYENHWKVDALPKENLFKNVIDKTAYDNIKVIVLSHPKKKITNFLPIPHIASSINQEALNKNMSVLSRKIGNTTVVLSNTIKDANIITGRKLINTMWGAKATQKYLNNKNIKVASLNKNVEALNMHKELMNRGFSKLQTYLREPDISQSTRKMISKVVIPGIIDSYERFKKISTDTMLEVSPLLHIEDVFQKNTNYPASWFISEETLDDLQEDFGFLSSFIGEIPIIESKVIIPLDILGSKITK